MRNHFPGSHSEGENTPGSQDTRCPSPHPMLCIRPHRAEDDVTVIRDTGCGMKAALGRRASSQQHRAKARHLASKDPWLVSSLQKMWLDICLQRGAGCFERPITQMGLNLLNQMFKMDFKSPRCESIVGWTLSTPPGKFSSDG